MGIKASLLVILVTLTFGFSIATAEEQFLPSENSCNPQDNPDLAYEEMRSCMLFYRFRAHSLANINQATQINTSVQAFTADGVTTTSGGLGINAVQSTPPDTGIVANGDVVGSTPPDTGIVSNYNVVGSTPPDTGIVSNYNVVGSTPPDTGIVQSPDTVNNNTTNVDASTLLLNIWRAK